MEGRKGLESLEVSCETKEGRERGRKGLLRPGCPGFVFSELVYRNATCLIMLGGFFLALPPPRRGWGRRGEGGGRSAWIRVARFKDFVRHALEWKRGGIGSSHCHCQGCQIVCICYPTRRNNKSRTGSSLRCHAEILTVRGLSSWQVYLK